MNELSTTLGAMCSHIVDCEHKTAPIDANGDCFAVGTPAMRDNAINYAQARRISRDTYSKWTKRLVPQLGDLLFAREAPVGPVVRLPELLNVAPGQRTVLLRPDKSVVEPSYLYYLMTSAVIQSLIQEYTAGSTVAHLNVADVRNLPLPILPELAEQRKVAAVMGALDDKIAANARISDTSMSLVDAKFESSLRLGTAAEDTFGALAEVGGGGTPSTADPILWGGVVAWATPTDVTALRGPYLRSTSRTISDEGLAACTSPMYPIGSILMTSRATIGAFAIAERSVAVNQGFIVVNARPPMSQWWLFHQMRMRVPEFLSHANGATFLELSRGRFKQLPVWLSDTAVMSEFHAFADAIHQRASAANRENTRLAELREALLPELMSGRLRVKDAERILEGAV